jgi:hypothetical protein
VTKIVNGMIKNCVLEPVDSNVASNIDTMVENGAKVIHIYFHFLFVKQFGGICGGTVTSIFSDPRLKDIKENSSY